MFASATTIVLRDSPSSWVSLAIPALSAVGGALVGGLVTGGLSLRSEDKRQDFARKTELQRTRREDADRAASVRGSIRLLRITLREAANGIRNALDTGAWWPEQLDLTPVIRPEDLAVLAASMTAADWTAVEYALTMAGRIQVARRVVPALTHEGNLPALDTPGRGALETAFAPIEAAVEVLRRVDLAAT